MQRVLLETSCQPGCVVTCLSAAEDLLHECMARRTIVFGVAGVDAGIGTGTREDDDDVSGSAPPGKPSPGEACDMSRFFLLTSRN